MFGIWYWLTEIAVSIPFRFVVLTFNTLVIKHIFCWHREQKCLSQSVQDMDAYLWVTDDVFHRIRTLPGNDSEVVEAKKILERIDCRDFYKLIGEKKVTWSTPKVFMLLILFVSLVVFLLLLFLSNIFQTPLSVQRCKFRHWAVRVFKIVIIIIIIIIIIISIIIIIFASPQKFENTIEESKEKEEALTLLTNWIKDEQHGQLQENRFHLFETRVRYSITCLV